MIITVYGLIVFQLTIWIGVIQGKQPWTEQVSNDMPGFSYQAKPSRHEVPCKTFHAVKKLI